MSTKIAATLAGWVALMAAASGWAYQVEDVRIEWWTGSGAHQVLLVVDFGRNNGQSDSFAFGYHFSQGSITGAELLDAIEAAGQGFSYMAPGGYLTDISYTKNGTTYHAGTDWPAAWWKYFTSLDWGTSWTESEFGIELRVLTDGQTDGWLTVPSDDLTSTPVTPLRGDMNCDGGVDFGDINPFVQALSSPAAYIQTHPDCSLYNADINGDGSVDFGDINPFVAMFQ